MTSSRSLIIVGGVSGIVLGVVQLAGIIMHGSIPADPGQGLEFVHAHPVWPLTHVLLISSYIVVVGFYVGLRASLTTVAPWLEIGANLTLVGATLGAVHFIIHLSLYPFLAGHHHAGADTMVPDRIITFYLSAHTYAYLLNRCSLIILMMVAIIFSFSTLREPNFKRWISILGVASSFVTLGTLTVVETLLPHSTGDIVFAVALLPTIVWVVAMGVAMLKIKSPGSPIPLSPSTNPAMTQ